MNWEGEKSEHNAGRYGDCYLNRKARLADTSDANQHNAVDLRHGAFLVWQSKDAVEP